MKGILIDPDQKSVEEIVSGFESGELHKLVGAEVLDFCYPFGPGEMMCVDDNGMYRELTVFHVDGYHWPIFGKAVIMGRDGQGETVSTSLSVEEVFEMVRFR
jgi:hypothetical protein